MRGSTLFYLEITPLTQTSTARQYKGSAKLYRYDLTSHHEVGSPIPLGDTSTFNGAEGNVTLVGWDVSPDGSYLAYQQTTITPGSGEPDLASKFFAANADGSNASPILTGAISNTPAFMAISPDGKWVAVTAARPSPEVLSDSVSGGKAYFYAPDAEGPPVWLADSSQFEADNTSGFVAGIARWSLNTASGKQGGCLAHLQGSLPATQA